MEDLRFPTLDYYLDQSDPDVVIARRQDGTFVAAFSARGATKEGILEATKEDRRELIGLTLTHYMVRRWSVLSTRKQHSCSVPAKNNVLVSSSGRKEKMGLCAS
jgi:hypothetical protein